MPDDPTKNAALANQLILSGLQGFIQGNQNLDAKRAQLEKELADRNIKDIQLVGSLLKTKGSIQESRADRESREDIAGERADISREAEAGKQGRFEQGQKDRFEFQRRQHAHEKQIAAINAKTEQSKIDKIVSRGIDSITKDVNKTAGNTLKVEFGRLGIKAADPEAAIERINNFEQSQKMTPEQAVAARKTVARTVLQNAKAEKDRLLSLAQTAVSEEQQNVYLQMAEALDASMVAQWGQFITAQPTRVEATAEEQETLNPERPLPDFSQGNTPEQQNGIPGLVDFIRSTRK